MRDPLPRDASAPVPDARFRVAAIAHSACLHAVGRQRYEALAAFGDVDVHLIVPAEWHEYGRRMSADPAERSSGITVHVEPTAFGRAGWAGWYLHVYPALKHRLKAIAPDVLHLWEEPWSAVATQAAWLRDRHFPQVPLILETDQNIYRDLPPPFSWLRRYALKRTDFLFCRQMEAAMVSRRAGYEGPLGVLEYGVDRSVFRPAGSRRRAAGDGLSLGYVGRLVQEKGLDDVIDAIALTDAPVTLTLVGDGPHRPQLESRAAAAGLPGRIRFLAQAPAALVADFINGLDALVLMSRTTPTWKEQFGRVIAEAQCCGVPVIGSSSGAIPGVVGAGGWIVPEGDARALADLLALLAREPDRLGKAAEAAYAQAVTRFSFRTVAGVLRDAYRQSLSGRATHGLGNGPSPGLPVTSSHSLQGAPEALLATGKPPAPPGWRHRGPDPGGERVAARRRPVTPRPRNG